MGIAFERFIGAQYSRSANTVAPNGRWAPSHHTWVNDARDFIAASYPDQRRFLRQYAPDWIVRTPFGAIRYIEVKASLCIERDAYMVYRMYAHTAPVLVYMLDKRGRVFRQDVRQLEIYAPPNQPCGYTDDGWVQPAQVDRTPWKLVTFRSIIHCGEWDPDTEQGHISHE
jgi:hypothetical protein